MVQMSTLRCLIAVTTSTVSEHSRLRCLRRLRRVRQNVRPRKEHIPIAARMVAITAATTSTADADAAAAGAAAGAAVATSTSATAAGAHRTGRRTGRINRCSCNDNGQVCDMVRDAMQSGVIMTERIRCFVCFCCDYYMHEKKICAVIKFNFDVAVCVI